MGNVVSGVIKSMALGVLALLPVFMAPTAVAAEIPWYEIELLVFERVGGERLTTETWPQAPGYPATTGAVEIGASVPDDASVVAFRRLPAEDYRLSQAERLLASAGEYRPLLHVAWRQPVQEQDLARAVHVTTRPGESPAGSIDSAPVSWLDGIVRISVARYLHVEADLVYAVPSPSAPWESGADIDTEASLAADAGPGPAGIADYESHPAPDYTWFRLTDRRRMRSGELHYLDHPVFGILVTATPYEPPAAPPAPQPLAPPAAPVSPTPSPRVLQPVDP
jgi:hypothetical protein